MLFDTISTLLSVSGSTESRNQMAAEKTYILYLVYEKESQLLHTTTHVVRQLVTYTFTTPHIDLQVFMVSPWSDRWLAYGYELWKRDFELSAKQRKGPLDSLSLSLSLSPLSLSPLSLSPSLSVCLSVCPSVFMPLSFCELICTQTRTRTHTHTHTHTRTHKHTHTHARAQSLSPSLSLSCRAYYG